MEKNIHTELNNANLLNDKDFVSQLEFETTYASIVKGGHSPYYFSDEKQIRLVSEINFLSHKEKQALVHNLFISKN